MFEHFHHYMFTHELQGNRGKLFSKLVGTHPQNTVNYAKLVQPAVSVLLTFVSVRLCIRQFFICAAKIAQFSLMKHYRDCEVAALTPQAFLNVGDEMNITFLKWLFISQFVFALFAASASVCQHSAQRGIKD